METGGAEKGESEHSLLGYTYSSSLKGGSLLTRFLSAQYNHAFFSKVNTA